MRTPPSTPLTLFANRRAMQWVAAVLWASALGWLLGSWGATQGWLSLPYTVDVPATLLCAALMLALGMAAAWRFWQLEQGHAQAARKDWLSVLLFKREEVDRAAQALEQIGELLESSQLARPTHNGPRTDMAVLHADQLQRISPELQPVLSRQSELRQHMQSFQARLVNLQVKFGRGDSIDALAYDLQPLSHEHQQLDSSLSQLFDELQALERARTDQWTQYHQQRAEQDPDAAWRGLLESALSQLEHARRALARSLDEAPPERRVRLDDYLGLRP